MAQIFGHYREEATVNREYLVMGFSPSSIPLQQRWRNNGLSADFLADYLTTFYPNDESRLAGTDRHTEIKSAVSYVANELLENAMKFHDDRGNYPVDVQLRLHSEYLVFSVTNCISQDKVLPFQNFIKDLLDGDPQELYIQRLEENAMDDNHSGSGLGLLTMVNDYMAKLGWKFEKVEEEGEQIVSVTTRVELPV